MAKIFTRFAMVLCAALLIAAGGASAARMQEVDLELLLGIDVSGSIDEDEAELQRAGYIAAFRDPMILRAIQSGILGRIAVAYVEWAGFGHKKVIAGWTVIHDQKSAEAFAARLTLEPPETARRTAIAEAIDFAVPYFDQNSFQGLRRVFDISGDGPNNWGGPVTEARDRAVKARITINGLPIMNDKPTFSGRPPMADLDLYYKNCVIGGPGAFIVVATGFRDFAAAVRRKLILEIAGLTPAAVPQPPRPILAAARQAPSCDTDEWRSRRFFGDDSDEFSIPR